jgi:hypothetical protein
MDTIEAAVATMPHHGSSLASFYTGKTIFLTGAT